MPALRVSVQHQNIYFNAYNSGTRGETYTGETHLKMTTRARAFFLLKNRIKSENQIMGIRLLLDFLKSDSTALVQTDPFAMKVKVSYCIHGDCYGVGCGWV